MKRKILIGIAIALCGLGAVLFIGRITGMIRYYRIPTPSNEPAIKVGDYIVTTKFKKPRNGDFICYETNEGGKEVTYIKRLCGMQGDRIEMKEGVFYLNGKNFDEPLDLMSMYLISSADAKRLLNEKEIEETEISPTDSPDKMMVFLSDHIVKKEKISCCRDIIPRRDAIESASFIFTQDRGSIDNFGPYVVPKGSYFVLGDNRHNSLDSRYTGFVSADRWVGTAIRKNEAKSRTQWHSSRSMRS